MKITSQIIEKHGLKIEEFQNIKKLLKREPNFLELGIFSAMWNEHCSYKSSRTHLKKLPTKGKQVIQGLSENAGVIDIGDDDAIGLKLRVIITHLILNHTRSYRRWWNFKRCFHNGCKTYCFIKFNTFWCTRTLKD